MATAKTPAAPKADEEKKARGTAFVPDLKDVADTAEFPEWSGREGKPNPFTDIIKDMPLGSAKEFPMPVPPDHPDVEATRNSLHKAGQANGVTVRVQLIPSKQLDPAGKPLGTLVRFGTREKITRPRQDVTAAE